MAQPLDWEQPHILPLCDWLGPMRRLGLKRPLLPSESADDCATVVSQDYGRSICVWNMDRRPGSGSERRPVPPGVLAWDFHPRSHGCKQPALCNPVVPEESKGPLCRNMMMEVELANGRGCEMLKNTWGFAQGRDSLLKYLRGRWMSFDWQTACWWPWNCRAGVAPRCSNPSPKPETSSLQGHTGCRTWNIQAIYYQGVRKYCNFKINNCKASLSRSHCFILNIFTSMQVQWQALDCSLKL